jgi:hypothetical protein
MTTATFSNDEFELNQVGRDIATGQASGKRQHTPARFSLEIDGDINHHESYDDLLAALKKVSASTEIDYNREFNLRLSSIFGNNIETARKFVTTPPTITQRIKIRIRITLDPPGFEITITF